MSMNKRMADFISIPFLENKKEYTDLIKKGELDNTITCSEKKRHSETTSR